MQRIRSTICENRAVTKEKSGVEHAGPIPSSESYPSFFLLLFLLRLPLPLISKRIKRRMRRIMILRMASLLFFCWWFSDQQHGWRPDPAPFFRRSMRCCRKTNEKRARQLRTTKLRNIEKLAEHLLGPELSRTIRDAEKLIQKMSREHQETLHLLPMSQGTPYSQTSETYFLNS